MTIPTFRFLFLCLLMFAVRITANPSMCESPKIIKNPQIQKHFLEFPQTWSDVEEKTIIASTRVSSWEFLDKNLEPNQQVVDISQVGYPDEEYGRVNYFELATDQSQPLYKLSDPGFASKDPQASELQYFKFDPPYLNFTESSLYITSVKPISFSNLSDKYEIKIIANRTDDHQLFLTTDETFTKLIKPGIKHKLKIGLVPSSLKNAKSAVFFTVQIIHNKRVIATRNLMYDVYIHGVKNPFDFEPIPMIKTTVGEYWKQLFAILNPFQTAFTIDHVSSDDEELEIKVPWNIQTMVSKTSEIKEDVIKVPNMSVIWNIAAEKKQTFLFLGYKGKAPGVKKMNLFIETSVQNFVVPVIIKTKAKTLILNSEMYDLGVVTNPKIPHEVQINMTNIYPYPVQILEIYASIPKTAPVRIFRLERMSVLEPLQQNKLIAKLRLLPTESNLIQSYEGKLLIQTNDTGASHFIEAKYRLAYYPNIIASSIFELSYFVRMQGENIYTDKKDDFRYVEDEATGGILELTKPVQMTNSFETTLEFQKIHFPSRYLTIQSHKNSIRLPLFTKMRVFDLKLRMPIGDLNLTHFNTWFAVESHGMLIPIHVYVYDKRLYCSMNIDGTEVMEKCYRAEQVSLKFGSVTANEARRKTLTLTNYNPNEISILSINCSIPNCFTDVVEASLEQILNEKNEVIMKDRKLLNEMEPNQSIYKGLPQNHKAVFSFIIDKSVEQFQAGEITIQTADEVIKMPIGYQVLQGNLTFTPQIVRFQPAFPGRRQEAKVSIRNTFNSTIFIKSMESENPEIIPVALSPILFPSERVDAFKIIFDPSKNKQFESLNFLASSTEYQYGISLEDLYSWKQKENVWEELITSSSTEIKDWVRLTNNVSERTFVQVRASLTKPSLISEPIDFGVTKVHARAVKNITIENPADVPIYVQLFLGPEEFSNLTYVSQILKPEAGEDILQGVIEKQQICLVDTMMEINDDKIFNEIFKDDKSLAKNYVRHYHAGYVVNKSKGEHELERYASGLYHCMEGNMNSIDSLRLNFTRRYTRSLIENGMSPLSFESINIQNIKETAVYEIKAMTYAQPKPTKAVRKAQTLLEKIKLYFQDWLEYFSFGGNKALLEQTALLEKLKQNIKEIYIQNFNSLQKEQQIFLNPEFRDVVIIIPARSNLTIPALIHQPTSNKEYEIKLYIKNNLTSIFQTSVKALGGSGNLIVTDVKRYDDTKKTFVRSTEELLEGDHDQKKMKFFLDRSEVPIVDATRCEECPPGTKKLRLDRPFKRRFTLKNDGNLPLEVSKISIQNLGCEGYGFFIDEGCRGFTLEPNQEWDLEIKFIPDMSLTYFTRTLILTTNQGNFEFEIHVKMPFKNIYDNFDLYHFKTRVYVEILCYLVIMVMTALCFKMIKEAFFIGKEKPWKIYGQEMLNYKHPNEIFENIISVKNTPMIPDAKLIGPKKPIFQVEKPVRTSKTPVRANESKEKAAVNLNKFEDSEEDDFRGMKFIEKTRRKAAKEKKEKPETPPDHEEVTPLPEVETPVLPENKPPKETPAAEKKEVKEDSATLPQQAKPKTQVVTVREEAPAAATQEKKFGRPYKDSKPYSRDKPYEGRYYEGRQYEGRTYEKRHYEPKQYGRTVRTFYEKKPSQPVEETTDKATPDVAETTKKTFEFNNIERDSGRKTDRKQQSSWKDDAPEEEQKKNNREKYSQENPDESAGLWSKLPDRPTRNNDFKQDNSDEDLEGEILDDETKQIIGNVFDRDDAEIGFIGAGAKQQQQQNKYSQPVANPSKPFTSFEPTFEPQQNLDQSQDHSEVTSEDEKGFYNYFGNYSRPQNDPFQDNSQSNFFSFFSNKNETANMPGLGLFQTKRKTSRYDTYTYFPASNAAKNQESPRRKFSNLNKTPFYTGSEDESGVFSESSYSAKPFYNRNRGGGDDDDETPTRTTFRMAGENNLYNFGHSFFPNIPQATQNVQKSNQEPSSQFGGIDESNLNYFFSDGVRFRDLKEANDPDSSDLPPGLH